MGHQSYILYFNTEEEKKKIIAVLNSPDKYEGKNGTCLEDTYNYLLSNRKNEDLRILHSTVLRKSDRLRHAHAVIYDNKSGNVIEVSNCFKHNPIEIPFMLWVKLGEVKDIKMYKLKQFTSLLLKTKMYKFYHLPDFTNYYD